MAFVVNDVQKSMEAPRHSATCYLYYDPMKGRGCSGDHDTGSFNAWRYVNCEVYGAWLDPDDLALRDESSAVALLSNLDRLFGSKSAVIPRRCASTPRWSRRPARTSFSRRIPRCERASRRNRSVDPPDRLRGVRP